MHPKDQAVEDASPALLVTPQKITKHQRDENLKSGPGKTHTWRSAIRDIKAENEAGREWATSSYWTTAAAQLLPNLAMIAIWVPLNLLILAVVAWPLILAYKVDMVNTISTISIISTYFLARAIMLYLQPDFNPQDQLPPKKRKKVAVIGAGPSGLCVAKELLAEGHIPVVFERDGAIGGTWQRGGCSSGGRGRVLPNTITSSSALNTCFSDFPIQAENPGHDPFHMSQADYMDYIQRYAKYFDLERHINLSREVVKIRRTSDDRWIVETKNVSGDKVSTEQFDAVSVCSGQVNVPRIPHITGQEHFSGEILHVSALTGEDPLAPFKNKRVLCVGSGETASDVSYDITKIAAKCDISIRNPVLVVPRNLWGVPPDYFEARSMYLCARWVRAATIKVSLLFLFFFNNIWARNYKGETIWVPSVVWIWKLVFTPKYFREVFRGERSNCSSVLFTKSDHILYALENKDKCSLRRGVCHVDKDGSVVFDCGTKQQYDYILLATGYNLSSYPFLPTGHENIDLRDRFVGTFHPDLPNMAFIGFMRGQAGSLILGFEMQARWFALLCSDKRSLPSKKDMFSAISLAKKRNHTYTNASAGSFFVANYIARHFVGCEPNFVRFFLKAPLACIKAYCGNSTSYQFRMRGPHMDHQVVKDGYALTDGIFYMPVGFHSLHLIWALQAPFFEFWSHVPVVGRYFTPHTSNWY